MKRVLLAATIVVAAGIWGAAPASAESLVIRRIDTTQFPEVKLSVQVSGQPSLEQFSLREGGRLIQQLNIVPIGETDTPVGVVLVIDTSGSMRQGDKIGQAKAAAQQFVSRKLPKDEAAVVAFNDQPRVVANFTADAGALSAAIGGLEATGETALWDAVRLGAGLFGERPDLQPNLVVLSDGADTVSASGLGEARSAVQSASAAVYGVGLAGGADFDGAALAGLVETTGGEYVETADPRTLGQLYEQVQRSIENQYELTYTSQAQGAVDVQLTVGDMRATASAPVGAASRTATNDPEPVTGSPLPDFLGGTVGKWLLAILVLAAAAVFVYGILLVILRERSDLESALIPYAEEGVEGTEGRQDLTFADSALMRRAVETTARLARERGILDKLEARLEQADLPLRPAEALFFYIASAVILAVLGLLLGGLFGFLMVGVAAALLPVAALSFVASRRQRLFASQLPDMLQLLAGSLRAGFSLMQGVDAVAQEVSDPMGKELRRVLAESRLGRPLEEALEDAAVRMGSADFDWAVMAVRIQREVGGNLAELLDTVAETMMARERLRREVRALTAEGRISAIILGILPVALGILMYTINPDYMQQLFDASLGKAMLAGSFVLALIGFYWMKKTIEIEI